MAGDVGEQDWRDLLPAVRGTLPLGGNLTRTDPGGSPDSCIAFLGAYPAATRLARTRIGAHTFLLPAAVEATSCEPNSRSGAQLREHCLRPLQLEAGSVRTFDLMPYFLANSAEQNGHSIWESISRYHAASGVTCGIQPRPSPDQLLREARSLPGNERRLEEYLTAPALRLLFTLGNEAAAWARGLDRASGAKRYLYREAEQLCVMGRQLLVVHLAHPGSLTRNAEAQAQHEAWCSGPGKALIASVVGGHGGELPGPAGLDADQRARPGAELR